jgi:hypothetical protein
MSALKFTAWPPELDDEEGEGREVWRAADERRHALRAADRGEYLERGS